MAELCAKYFTDQKPQQLTIANRSMQKGKMLAEKINCQSILLGDVHHHISNYDIVICSTSSQLPIIGMGMIQNALQTRKHKPMLLVDLAIPRDVEVETGTLDDIFLYTFDDLAKLAQEGVKNRESEIINATKIIEKKVQTYKERIEQKTITPTIKLLRNQFEKIRKEELLKAEKAINKGTSINEAMDKFSKTLSKKYLHHPTKVFNELSNKEFEKALAILKKIYKVED